MDRVRDARRRRMVAANAVMGSPHLFFPEARISNSSGDPRCIRIGANTAIRGTLLTFPQGGQITIGDWCYVGHRSEIWSADSVTIGDRVLIAHDVSIVDTTAHARDAEARHEHYRRILAGDRLDRLDDVPGVESSPIVIEDDVWISFGVKILRGVRIGRESVVAAGSIVMKDVPPKTLYRMQVTPVMGPLVD